MDTELLTVARTLAERGWLPGICWYSDAICPMRAQVDGIWRAATESDLHLAAHREIVRRGWWHQSGCGMLIPGTAVHNERGYFFNDDGTDTLALLRCLLAACEAAEAKR